MCVIRIMPPLTLADLRLRSIHRKKGTIRIKFLPKQAYTLYLCCLYTMFNIHDNDTI